MAKTPYARLFVATVTALALLAGASGSGFAAEPETGSIAGRYTDDGAPVTNTSVSANSLDGSTFAHAVTNEAGEYQISDLPPGQYRVSFGSAEGGPGQSYRSKAHFFEADPVTVVAGEVTRADDEELPWGRIQGTVRDRAGVGIAGAYVEINPVEGGSFSGGPTDSSGAFGFPVRLGRYKVRVQINPFTPASFTQWVPGVSQQAQAQIFEVGDGQIVTIDETLMPTGRVSGRFTDAAGNGLADIFIMLDRDGTFPATARTGPDGSYAVPYVLTGGQFKVHFQDFARGISQYAHGTVDPAQATLFSVSEGQELVINESLLPTGSVRVTAKDAANGAAISSFGASLVFAGYGETTTGEVVIENVPIGTHPLHVFATGFEETSTSITVTAGQQASAEVTMRSKSKIEASVVDAATGEPVSGVCLVVVTLQSYMLPDGCFGSLSDAQGRAVAETPGPGWYQILAYPSEAEGYGAQWVGANGGSGSQLNAKLIRVEAGKGSQAPVIKLDRAGSITGIVRDTAGEPVMWADAAIGPWSNEVGGGIGVTTTDEDGRYTLNKLGPYQWPLLFQVRSVREYAGGVANRHLAQTVSVHSGQTTSYDFRLRAPVAVTANVSVNTPGDCYLYVVNAITGDRLGSGWAESCTAGSIPIDLVGPQVIKLSVVYLSGEDYVQKWYGGGSFLTAKPVILPASGSKTLNLRF